MNGSSRAALAGGVMLLILAASIGSASDHLDTPTVSDDAAADIGDLYAWTSSDGRRLNLVMTIVAHRFSDRLQYVFHVDSGRRFGATTATTSMMCRFDAESVVECWAGDADHVRGNAGDPLGLEGRNRRFRVFAGVRDDPFFNNVKGSRAALEVAAAALRNGATTDAARCPRFDTATSDAIFDHWRHTDSGPGTNFLAGWTPASLVVSVDLDVVAGGGGMLAVWAAVYRDESRDPSTRTKLGANGIPARPGHGVPIERMGRALTANALLATLGPEELTDLLRENYNRASQAEWVGYTVDIARGLALYDGFDGDCGNQWMIDRSASPAQRYRPLARLLADDRLWVNSRSTVCTHYLAVELTRFADGASPNGDCGGRTPNHDAVDVFRSLLALGTTAGLEDGVDRDEHVHSNSEFPFLAAP